MAGHGECRTKHLPRGAAPVIRAAPQPLEVRPQGVLEHWGQARQRTAVRAVRPQEEGPGLRAPGGEVAPPQRRPCTGHRLPHEEHVVGSGLHTELRRPPLAHRGERGAHPAGHSRGVGVEHPGPRGLQRALGHARRRAPRPERSDGHVGRTGLGAGRDQRHGVHGRGAEGAGRIGERRGAIEPRAVREPLPQWLRIAARGELRRYEQRDAPAGRRELEPPLDERHGEVGKVAESPPGGRAPGGVAVGERLAHAGRQPLASHPRRVADDEIEATARYHVAEMGLEREERRVAFPREPTGGRAQLATTRPEPAQAPALVARQAAPPAEQVTILSCGHELRDRGVEQPHGAREGIAGEGRHGPLDIGARPPLGRTGEVEEGAASIRQPRDVFAARARRASAPQCGRERQRVEQHVSLAHVAVEVRQGSDAGEVRFRVVGYEREPQTQLGQPHRGELQIHAEQRVGKDVSLEPNDRPLARRPAQRNQLLQRAEQECTGTHGGVHHLEAPQVREPRWQRGLTVVDPALRRVSGEAEPADERGLEPRPHELPHERGRRVEAAAHAALVRIHHPFEHAAQHVRCDRLTRIGLIHGKVEPLEQLVEGLAPLHVAP